jgi:O-antigen ligase
MDQVRYLVWLAVIIFLSLSHIAWDQNWIYVVQDFMKIYRYGYGSLDNNGAGLLIAMGIPFAYAFAMIVRHWLLKLACVCSGLIMMHVVLLTFSRGAMLSSIVALSWIALIHRPRLHVPVGVAGLVMLISIMAGPEVRERFFSISEYQKDESASTRLESWAAAWEMAWDHPLTGMGVRNANFFGETYGTDFWGRTIHSVYLQIAADSGIPAMAVFILIALAALWNTQRTRMMLRSVHDDPPDEDDPSSDQGPRLTEQQRRRHRLVYYIAVGLQGSLITFFFGAIFLSVETLELAWLEIAMAGALPGLTEKMLAGEPDASLARTGARPVSLPVGRRRLTELAEAGP